MDWIARTATRRAERGTSGCGRGTMHSGYAPPAFGAKGAGEWRALHRSIEALGSRGARPHYSASLSPASFRSNRPTAADGRFRGGGWPREADASFSRDRMEGPG
ncbi:MAG: hypothetical protein AMXMBFR25_03620 [Lysobacterales bacterium]